MGIGKIGSLKDRVVVITGAGRGIGKEIALACAKEGAQLFLTARSPKEIAETEKEAKQLGATCASVACDVGKDGDVARFFAKISQSGAQVYALICAAGIQGTIGPFDETPIGEWERVLQTNVLGTIRCVRAALPQMRKQREGRIILFSGAGQGPMPRLVPYATSKGAIWRLTESLGAELAPDNIYVNAIAPGAVNTRLLKEVVDAGPEKAGKELYENMKKLVASGATPAQKAVDLALFLMQKESAGLWGKIISAAWDPYRELGDLKKVSETDLFTVRRVVDADGGTRVKK